MVNYSRQNMNCSFHAIKKFSIINYKPKKPGYHTIITLWFDHNTTPRVGFETIVMFTDLKSYQMIIFFSVCMDVPQSLLRPLGLLARMGFIAEEIFYEVLVLKLCSSTIQSAYSNIMSFLLNSVYWIEYRSIKFFTIDSCDSPKLKNLKFLK